MRGTSGNLRTIWERQFGERPIGHPHMWDRVVSRRRLLDTSAAVAGAAIGAPWLASVASAAPPGPGEPRPIPETLAFGPNAFHVQLPGPGVELSLITDFEGTIGVADILGTAIGTGDPANLTFDADVRFMDGHFLGTDGRVHVRTVGFV